MPYLLFAFLVSVPNDGDGAINPLVCCQAMKTNAAFTEHSFVPASCTSFSRAVFNPDTPHAAAVFGSVSCKAPLLVVQVVLPASTETLVPSVATFRIITLTAAALPPTVLRCRTTGSKPKIVTPVETPPKKANFMRSSWEAVDDLIRLESLESHGNWDSAKWQTNYY